MAIEAQSGQTSHPKPCPAELPPKIQQTSFSTGDCGNQQRRRVPVTRTRRWSAQLPASLGHRSQSGLPPLSHVHARPATSHLTPALHNSLHVDTRRRDGGGREGRGRTVEPRGSGRGEGGRPPTRRSLTDSLGPSSTHPSTPP